jgi:hypothetical protein
VNDRNHRSDQEDPPDLEPLEPFEDGYNRRTILAALFVGFVMLPGSIYLSLVMGEAPGGAAQWVTVILFVEVAKRSLVTLKRQELLLIYLIAGTMIAPGVIMGAAGLTLSGGAFAEPIWRQFLVRSPQAEAFGLTHEIPAWIVPPAGADSLVRRTFFSADWMIPIVVLLIHQLLFRVNSLSMSYGLYRITSDIERLEFPMAPVAAEGATALADSSGKKETWRWRLFGAGAMIGLAYGFVYVAIPTFTGIVLTQPLALIPIPYLDFTERIGSFMNGSMFGIYTDLGLIFVGFVLPFRVVAGMFCGSMVSKFILPPFLVKAGIITTWRDGMEARPTEIAQSVDLYISVSIGLGLVVALLGIGAVLRTYLGKGGGGKQFGRTPKEARGRGEYSLRRTFLWWALSSLAYVVLCVILVPDFPVWILVVFGFVLSPVLSYMSARMTGITGSPMGVDFPLIREGSFILSGHRGADIWFAPIPYFNHGSAAQSWRMLELTRTKFVSMIKMTVLAFFLTLITSFLFWSLIWKMGPIPSSTYPFVQKMWPYFAKYKALWATSTLGDGQNWMIESITLGKVAAGFGAGWLVYGVTTLIGIPSTFFYGVVGGSALWPHYAIVLFIGALLGKYFFAKKFGEENWKKFTPVLAAGYYCGIGLIGMVAAAFALIGKAVSPLVF